MTKRIKRPCLTMHYADGTDENIHTVVFRFGDSVISGRLKFETTTREDGNGECFFDVSGLEFLAWYMECVARGARKSMKHDPEMEKP